MSKRGALLIVHFLVPVAGREGKRYPRTVHDELRRDLEQTFGGWSTLGNQPLPGAWRNPASGQIEPDKSWRYEVGIDQERLEEFDDFLGNLAYQIGQEAIWRVVYLGGVGKSIPALRPESSGT